MMDKAASREWRARLRDVLNTEWDPIGGCPPDEYDSYGGKIAAMVRAGCSDNDLKQYLLWAESENMGLSPGATVIRPEIERTVLEIRKLGPLS